MSHPQVGHDYDEPVIGKKYKNEAPAHVAAKKAKVAKKMTPTGKLKAMVDDKPSSLAGQLDWFKKHGTPKHPKHP